ncbi:MAG TPA: GNAT family N-acetyltransferase [Methanocorpusculum sp.]|nr:GNAT family N-acetyltransferase [Methanocorpusculum sp.]
MYINKIYCRPAERRDADLLFEWVNDSKVRKNSLSSEKISYSEHINWFSKVLSDDSVEIYIYYLDDEPIGQVRLNYSDNEVSISYSIAKKYRGQGYGKYIIHDIEKIIIKNHSEVNTIHAKVKGDNTASQKIFEDNEYNQTSSEHTSQNQNILEYRKTIDKNSIQTKISEDLHKETEPGDGGENTPPNKQQKRTQAL